MIVVYRKSDLACVGTVTNGMTFEQEIETNVIPNFGGVAEDYDFTTEEIPETLYLPKWDGTAWIEGKIFDPEVELQLAKDAKILELNTLCNQLILGGFISDATGTEHQYKFDMEYQGNFSQQGVMLSLDPTAAAVPWPTRDAGVLVHTREQFIQLCKDAQEWKATNTYRYFDLKAQIQAAGTIDLVNLFTW